jgi:PHD/YefM family antitoxin component YafN of YafNO toxin-antitoxin module
MPLRRISRLYGHLIAIQTGIGSGSKLRSMANMEVQFVSSESGEPTAVIVPIELWREIESERETAYLLKSETMRARLLHAAQRQTGLSFEAVIEKLGV